MSNQVFLVYFFCFFLVFFLEKDMYIYPIGCSRCGVPVMFPTECRGEEVYSLEIS